MGQTLFTEPQPDGCCAEMVSAPEATTKELFARHYPLILHMKAMQKHNSKTVNENITDEELYQQLQKKNTQSSNRDYSECFEDERVYNVGTYIGQMNKNGQRCGYGVCQYTSGNISYSGYWWDDKYDSEGTFKDEQSQYDGQWVNGKKSGFGQEIWFDDRTRYIGQFENGLKHGQGKYIWRSGNIYEGEFEDDIVNGYGTLWWPDDREYEGEWKNGVQHGKGIFVDKEGRESVVYFWQGAKLKDEKAFLAQQQKADAEEKKAGGSGSAGAGAKKSTASSGSGAGKGPISHAVTQGSLVGPGGK
ncbi:unnamed protein product [Amoebophrya sp. A120]|nr:unnamed protein product [Amoebophrya sp. A120]|eukprot:GSA120T00006776001.1